MSPCGCKGKKVISPAQQPAKITIIENGEEKTIPLTPSPSSVPTTQDVNNIVNKLNDILT